MNLKSASHQQPMPKSIKSCKLFSSRKKIHVFIMNLFTLLLLEFMGKQLSSHPIQSQFELNDSIISCLVSCHFVTLSTPSITSKAKHEFNSHHGDDDDHQFNTIPSWHFVPSHYIFSMNWIPFPQNTILFELLTRKKAEQNDTIKVYLSGLAVFLSNNKFPNNLYLFLKGRYFSLPTT
jgi:hypothetical protein